MVRRWGHRPSGNATITSIPSRPSSGRRLFANTSTGTTGQAESQPRAQTRVHTAHHPREVTPMGMLPSARPPRWVRGAHSGSGHGAPLLTGAGLAPNIPRSPDW